MTSWHNQHTIGHHIYTNIYESDPDLPKDDSGDIRRLVGKQSWLWVRKYQHLYLPILYGLLGISMRIADITEVFGKNQNAMVRVNPHGFLGYLNQIMAKLTCFVWRIAIPYYYFLKNPDTSANTCINASLFVGLTIIMEMMTGYWLAFNFQVSHISAVADFPMSGNADVVIEKYKTTNKKDLDNNGNAEAVKVTTSDGSITYKVIPHNWAEAQVIASVDYSHDSWWTTFCCGALNYQTEHHLLPSVSQYHYPAIAPIVRQVCKKHGVRYNYLPNFYVAFYYHVLYLYKLGQEGKSVPLETSLH